jgi:hypothetical protein
VLLQEQQVLRLAQQLQEQQHQLAWHQQQVLQERLVQQLALVRVLEQLLLFYRRQPKQQQRSRQPKRGTWS